MESKTDISDIRVLLLVGGKGTRLQSVVSGTPKPLATVGKTSFLELLVRQLKHQGIHHLVMCTGYLADQIEEYFGDGNRWGVSIEYSREQSPLGTGGAVRLASQSHVPEDASFMVMNGDSFVQMNFSHLLHFHRQHRGLASLAALHVDDAARYGTVQVGENNHVIGFLEKSGKKVPGLVNAGVYIFEPRVLEFIPEGMVSLENDVFPVMQNEIRASIQSGVFIDIGTPEDYARAQEICEQLSQAATDFSRN